MIKINLVPEAILAKARQRQFMLQAAAGGGILALVLALASFGHWIGLRRLQSDFAYKQSKLKQLAAIVAQVEELDRAAAAVRARLDVIGGLLKGRALYPLFMSEFARTVPARIQVTQLGTVFQGDGGLKLAISARAAGNLDIASWVRGLENNPHFSGVELGAVAASGAGQYSFTISTLYRIKL